jgi:hypothetical protein
LILSIPLSLVGTLRKSRQIARVALRLAMAGIGLNLLWPGMVGLAISIPLAISFLTAGQWLGLFFVPILWLFGAGFIAGGVKTLQRAVRRDRDPLTQWGMGNKIPDDWT